MSFIVYGGVKFRQTRHAIRCRKCLDIIESKFIHEFKCCSCNTVGIDGGILPGNRILGHIYDIEDRRMYCAIVKGKIVWLPYEVYAIKNEPVPEPEPVPVPEPEPVPVPLLDPV